MSEHLSAERLNEFRWRAEQGKHWVQIVPESLSELLAHIDAITEDRDKWEKVAISRRKERDEMAAAIQRVRALHSSADKKQFLISFECINGLCDHDCEEGCPDVETEVCKECSALATMIDGGECFILHPCSTARALDGGQE